MFKNFLIRMAKPLRKRERDACWKGRDEYFQCFNDHVLPHLIINKEKKVLDVGPDKDSASLMGPCESLKKV